MPANAIALFGGTFDPVHQGHILPLLELADQFHWQEIHLLPTFAPPHRPQPEASHQQRLTMLQLACQQDPRLKVNDWELRTAEPSRTIRTLRYFRDSFPHQPIYFVMGMDSLVQLDQWLDWQQLTDYAHLVALPRPDYYLDDASATLHDWLASRICKVGEEHGLAGQVLLPETCLQDISATEIRQWFAEHPHHDETPHFLDAAVFRYIHEQNLYR